MNPVTSYPPGLTYPPGVGPMPRVSIVVPFFNAERFLDQAVQSVLAQTWQDWELLLVDDGSTDGSGAIARRYVMADPGRIRCLEHPGHRNLGLPASRNLGHQHARGEFLAPLDADDVWLPDKLTQQVAVLDAHPDVALVFGAPLYWYGWTGEPEDQARDHVIDLKLPADRVYLPPNLLLPLLRGEAPWICPCDTLMRRNAVTALGGFDFPWQVCEDTAFFSKMLLHYPAFVSSRTWDRYRQRPDSMWATSKATGTHDLARRRYLRWFEDYLGRQGVGDGPVWEAAHARLAALGSEEKAEGHGPTRIKRGVAEARGVARAVIPARVRWWIKRLILGRADAAPPPGAVGFGNLRRVTPVSRRFGWDRGGLPVDRYYIEQFLGRHRDDLRGMLLEFRDDAYARRFGGEGVTRVDVLHPTPDNPHATIVGDLTRPEDLPCEAFDCVIMTQVLPFIFDAPAAIRGLHQMLRPGGVVLATVPGISHIIRYDMDRWGDYWRFTSLSARMLFEREFGEGQVEVEAHGNVLAATGFLYGLGARELRPEELDHPDRDYEVLITVRAVKRGRGSAPLELRADPGEGGVRHARVPWVAGGATVGRATGANLILGLAEGMTAAQLEPFLRSTLALRDRPEIMLFGGKFDGDAMALLDEYRVRIAPFRSLWEGTRRRRNRAFTVAIRAATIAARAATSLFALRGPRRPAEVQRRMIGPLLPPLHARFFAYLEALEALYPEVQRVFLTDVRDVVFQDDPFRFTADKVWAFEEDTRAGMQFSPLNRSWYVDTFGWRAWRQVEGCPAICAGTILGGREAMLRYLRALTGVMLTRPPVIGGDQAIHNYVCREGLVPVDVMANEAGAVLTLQSMAAAELRYDSEGRVVNRAGDPYPVLHMYDRIPELRRRVLARLGIDGERFDAEAKNAADLRTHW
jgi:glycosyltransferase involved in cell wall biosynthesis/SAM-dependent methyltransferase